MTFPVAINLAPSPSAIDISASERDPTCLATWIYTSGIADGRQMRLQRVAIGYCDGSVLLLQSSPDKVKRSTALKLLLPADLEETSSRPSSPLRYPGVGRRSIRSASPSSVMSTFAPLQVAKPRVVSAVSTEQAEAPKNYVDFEDEPEKLKGMLKGKSLKDRTVVDAYATSKERLSPSDDAMGANLERASPSWHSPLIVTPASDGSSSRSSLSSSFPRLGLPEATGSPYLSVVWHAVPRACVLNASVISLQAVQDGHLLVTLQQNGIVTLICAADGLSLSAFTPEAHNLSSNMPIIWEWKSLKVVTSREHHIVVATASSIVTTSNLQSADSIDGDGEDQTRIIAIEFRQSLNLTYEESVLTQIGDWVVHGPAEGVSVHRPHEGTLEVIYVDSAQHIIRQALEIHEYPLEAEATSKSQSNIHLPIPNPFRAFANHSSDNLQAEDKEGRPRLFERAKLERGVDVGALALHDRIIGIELCPTLNGLRGLVWSSTELSGFECSGNSLRNVFSRPTTTIRQAKWKDPATFILVFSDHAEEHSLVDIDDHNIIASTGSSGAYALRNIQPNLLHSITLLQSDAYAVTTSGDILTTRLKKGRRRVEYTSVTSDVSTSYTVFRGADNSQNVAPRVSTVLPLELDEVILGFTDGFIRGASLSWLLRNSGEIPLGRHSDIALGGSITSLHPVRDARSTETVLLGGSDDGGIGIWSLKSLKLIARWITFLSPLESVVLLSEGRLRGCALCIAQDGTIAVVAVDEAQFLFLVPASIARLTKISTAEDNLLSYYADSRARLWDLRTREHWRTMTSDKADEMIKTGGWTTWQVGETTHVTSPFVSAAPGGNLPLDAAATLVVDIEGLLAQLGANVPPSGTRTSSTDTNEILELKANQIRDILASLLTIGLNQDIDRICHDRLKIPATAAVIGLASPATISLSPTSDRGAPWCVSAETSAVRALGIVSLLHALLQTTNDSEDAHTIITFYTASLAEAVGEQYQAPNLSFLAWHWLRTSANPLRIAARALCDSGIARLTDDELERMVQLWHQDLPSIHLTKKDHIRCAIALFICGSIAIPSYALLSTSYLTQIAKSIALYLHDETSPYRALAIDLCSRGFPVWQQYVDAVQMLRALFTLSTSTRKEAISVQNVGPLARTAVLQIASSNTPLFMTTLSLDILNPGTVQHRKSVMQLVIFLIRKKPLVLYSNLPRLVEAVVKSLDPNTSGSRDAILDFATEILGHIVQSFPTVDFHMGTQRLAVGTSEGSVVMYDLKTATRLYVLEGHKKRTTACSFSPDGRRLVTVSLDESAVLVWKVGSSFTSFFTPGAPPRQGHGGSEPFKTLSFNIGDEATMSLEATLDLVHFEWPSDRSVKLNIRDSILTFST